MKILFVSNYCGYMGGVEQYIADISRGLASRGHKLYLAFFEKSSRLPEEYAGLFTGSFQLTPGKNRGIDENSGARQIIRDIRPDVVFVHKVEKGSRLLADCSGIPAVRMVHDHDLCCPRRHKYFIWNSGICNLPFGIACFADLAFIEKKAGSCLGIALKDLFGFYSEMRRNRSFDCLMAGSGWMRQELIMNGFPEEKVFIQAPVVNLPAVEYMPPIDNRSMLYVGQLVRGKGIDLLIKALSLVKADFRLRIVGEGNARAELAELIAKSALEGKVELCGWIDRSELVAYYRKCLFTVVPSRWPEPFGMVGLEAMNFGRAVAGFAAGGISDWLQHERNGLLAGPGNFRELAENIERLLSNPDLAARMGLAGRQMIETDFSFARSVDRLEEKFEELIKAKKTGRGLC